MENEKKGNNEMSIELNPEVAGGTYSNLAIITHSDDEFILDFANMLPGMPKPGVRSRIIMTPKHAKRLLHALSDNIQKYESHFGPIDMSDKRPNQNEATLKEVAKAGNGAYVHAGNNEFGLNPVIDNIRKLNDEEFNSIVFEEYDEQYMYFFAIALGLLVLQMLVGERKVLRHIFDK